MSRTIPFLFKLVNRTILLPTAGFTLGIGAFIKAWPDDAGGLSLNDGQTSAKLISATKSRQPMELQRTDILEQVEKSEVYKELAKNDDMEHILFSEKIPSGHRQYHVGQGLLFGKGKLEIDPLVFHDLNRGEVTVIYRLGAELGNRDGNVHKGLLSLLLDEALCYCGFPLLPSKRGVTARLSLEFLEDIPVDTTIMLKASVKECKGRKCIIEGHLEEFPPDKASKKMGRGWNLFAHWGSGDKKEVAKKFVKANCVLVEPTWFKHFKWLDMF
ncbi:YBL095W [Saccharomyces arboricola H-6]|uniref:YBL095W n=1 Tax=Saccharomyces arboricola (strain H-6 / AS 2.3317 / CBS 10644) TaxID=1160507 RepID=J8PR67_SACAR|nr:YBL095W [Saccharomyces arboricola H-6]